MEKHDNSVKSSENDGDDDFADCEEIPETEQKDEQIVE
jgi:hypothetical protein|tara:strand:+ start:113 stop:226 length:114 start_codon:yes stop_codon:yes gene_type:complete